MNAPTRAPRSFAGAYEDRSGAPARSCLRCAKARRGRKARIMRRDDARPARERYPSLDAARRWAAWSSISSLRRFCYELRSVRSPRGFRQPARCTTGCCDVRGAAQEEVWGAIPSLIASDRLSAGAREKVEGGYVIGGK